MGFGRRARQIGSVHSAFVAPSLLLRSRLVSLASAIFSWRIRSDQHSAHSYELPLRWVDVLNPATNQLVTKVPQSTQQVCTLPLSSALEAWLLHLLFIQFTFRLFKEMERAVESAKSAFSTWSKTTPLARQQVERETGLLSRRPTVDCESQCDQPPR